MDLDLEKLMSMPRQYAPYYETGDCQTKEMGILRKIRSPIFNLIYVIMPPKPCADGYMETLTEIDYYSVSNLNQLYEYRCKI